MSARWLARAASLLVLSAVAGLRPGDLQNHPEPGMVIARLPKASVPSRWRSSA